MSNLNMSRPEGRQTPRYRLRLDSWVSIDSGHQYGGVVMDVSHRGCRLHSFMPVRDGMACQLQLRLPGNVAPLLISGATVRWIHQALCGIEFLLLDPLEAERLDQMMMTLPSTAST